MPAAERSRRSVYLTVTMEPHEKEAVERAARAAGNTASSWARWAMLKAIPAKSEAAPGG